MNTTWQAKPARRYWRHDEDTGIAAGVLASVGAEQQQSGMTVRAICRQRGASEHSFYQWRKRLAAQLPMKFALVETSRSAPLYERLKRHVLSSKVVGTALTRYEESPDLSIDNNHRERSLRGWAVGRGNWTFFGSDGGGRTAAVLSSLVASCELVKVDPFAWFHDVLSRIAARPITRLEDLLPHRWSQARA